MREFERVANRVSDAIVDIANTELVLMSQSNRIDRFAILAGQLLALKAAERNLPLEIVPEEFARLFRLAGVCLAAIIEADEVLAEISMPRKKLIEAETPRDRA